MGCDPALEADFVVSWERTIRFYETFLKSHEWAYLDDMRALVTRLHDHGYNRTLRAGQSMTTFLVSRSREHGLREDQPCLVMSPMPEHVSVSARHFAGSTSFTMKYDDELDRVLELLDELERVPID